MKIKKVYDVANPYNIIYSNEYDTIEKQATIYDKYSDWDDRNYIKPIKTIEKLDVWKILQQNDLSACVNKINEIIDTVNQLARR